MYKNFFYLSSYVKNKNIKNTKNTNKLNDQHKLNDQNKKEYHKSDNITFQLLFCLP